MQVRIFHPDDPTIFMDREILGYEIVGDIGEKIYEYCCEEYIKQNMNDTNKKALYDFMDTRLGKVNVKASLFHQCDPNGKYWKERGGRLQQGYFTLNKMSVEKAANCAYIVMIFLGKTVFDDSLGFLIFRPNKKKFDPTVKYDDILNKLHPIEELTVPYLEEYVGKYKDGSEIKIPFHPKPTNKQGSLLND